jgi:hypothetical protein
MELRFFHRWWAIGAVTGLLVGLYLNYRSAAYMLAKWGYVCAFGFHERLILLALLGAFLGALCAASRPVISWLVR